MANNGKWARLKQWVSQRRKTIGVVSISFVLGVLAWVGFNAGLEATNTEAFCISCHEMSDNVYVEYRNSIHYQNASGVRATCADCHVPKEWGPKMLRKLEAYNDVLQTILGSADTPEKFNERRQAMAEREWARMKARDSQNCRSCHKADHFDFSQQGRRAAETHQQGLVEEGKTCIDCHKGIAHSLPQIDQGVGAARPDAVPDSTFHSDRARSSPH
ncbi:cytochrome c-type protein NapC [Alcaligenaceae bacterium SJ-26]|nr:cytochrome c-type protein NapC [Alcaligenaceae bacterium SJ-26]